MNDIHELNNRLENRERMITQIGPVNIPEERWQEVINRAKKPAHLECMKVDTSLPVDDYIGITNSGKAEVDDLSLYYFIREVFELLMSFAPLFITNGINFSLNFKRLENIHSMFGQLLDVLEDVWIEVALNDIQKAERIIDEVPKYHPFQLRYERGVGKVDWESCVQVLDKSEKRKYLMRTWN